MAGELFFSAAQPPEKQRWFVLRNVRRTYHVNNCGIIAIRSTPQALNSNNTSVPSYTAIRACTGRLGATAAGLVLLSLVFLLLTCVLSYEGGSSWLHIITESGNLSVYCVTCQSTAVQRRAATATSAV